MTLIYLFQALFKLKFACVWVLSTFMKYTANETYLILVFDFRKEAFKVSENVSHSILKCIINVHEKYGLL